MTLADWQARWDHHIPAQALAELTAILSPVMPSARPHGPTTVRLRGRHRYVWLRAGLVCRFGGTIRAAA